MWFTIIARAALEGDFSFIARSYCSLILGGFRLVQTIFRFAETKFRFVEAKLRSNDTKFATKLRLMPGNFVSINHLACEISLTLEQ